ncbi:MAG TPA: hypothetical protein EYP86_00750 [Candidatus Altiarchaeales archaeon]|nr:hypothetical protein [Candidatus Altiarchaeales archaeon]
MNNNAGYALQNMPTLDVDPFWTMHIAFYDHRTSFWDIRHKNSRNNGDELSFNMRISYTSFYDEYFMGDYIGLVSDENAVFVTWSGSRNGSQDIHFASGFGIIIMCGDVNGDGSITPVDLSCLYTYIYSL